MQRSLPRRDLLDGARRRTGTETTMKPSRWLAAFALVGAAAAHAQPLPSAAPESVGMSSERLRRIETFFAGEMERNRVPGAVVAIARQGKLVYFKAFGFADKAKGIPATTETVF